MILKKSIFVIMGISVILFQASAQTTSDVDAKYAPKYKELGAEFGEALTAHDKAEKEYAETEHRYRQMQSDAVRALQDLTDFQGSQNSAEYKALDQRFNSLMNQHKDLLSQLTRADKIFSEAGNKVVKIEGDYHHINNAKNSEYKDAVNRAKAAERKAEIAELKAKVAELQLKFHMLFTKTQSSLRSVQDGEAQLAEAHFNSFFDEPPSTPSSAPTNKSSTR